MKLLRPVLTLSLIVIFYSALQAQKRCATAEYQALNRVLGKVTESNEQFEKALAAKINSRSKEKFARINQEPYKIPVVVHVIHFGEAVGQERNISDAQIISQIEVLNRDFKRLNADTVNTPAEFKPLAGRIDIEFVLAKQDPNGNCTSGIVRVTGTRSQWSMSREAELKALSYWPAEDYLNIWVIKFQGYLGYAQFPVSSGLPGLEENNNRLTDGIMVDYRVFGNGQAGPFDLNPRYNRGRSTTHEVGHFLGLRHIWGDDTGCSGSDYANDTPNQDEETYSPPVHPYADDCSPAIMFQNYMDYTDDVAMNLFSRDQAARMVTVLENSPRRTTLLTSHGLQEPATEDQKDLQVTDADFPSEITCANNRSNKTPLTITVNNVTTPVVDTLSYSVSVNQAPSFTVSNVPVSFNANNQAHVKITSLPGLAFGTNTVTLTVRADGCDPTPENNSITFAVTLLDDTCDPFVIYNQPSGQSAITFDLDQTAYTRISIINVLGQEIVKIDTPETTNQKIPFSILPGVYIVRIQIGGTYYIRKVYLHP